MNQVSHFLDNRGLEPPEPMRRTLERLNTLAPGEVLEIINDRRPLFLLQELAAMGCVFEVEELPGGQARLRITRS